MDNGKLKHQLKAIISRHVGRCEAIGAETLAEMFGFKDDRIIRKAIEELIDDNFPVCSVTEQPAGYFFPASVQEARRYSKSLQKRAVRIFLRRRHIIKNTALFYEPARQEELPL
jgi:hypothetical protein